MFIHLAWSNKSVTALKHVLLVSINIYIAIVSIIYVHPLPLKQISLKTSELFWDTEISTAILKVSDLRTV